MPPLVGAGGGVAVSVEIKSIRRLIQAIDQVDKYVVPAMGAQVQNIRDKLNRGVEFDGDKFAPYKDPSRFKGRRPLQYAARLFNEARVDVSGTSFGNVELSATIVGTPATIAIWQNVMRDFLSYSKGDKAEMKKMMIAGLKESYRRVS